MLTGPEGAAAASFSSTDQSGKGKVLKKVRIDQDLREEKLRGEKNQVQPKVKVRQHVLTKVGFHFKKIPRRLNEFIHAVKP